MEQQGIIVIRNKVSNTFYLKGSLDISQDISDFKRQLKVDQCNQGSFSIEILESFREIFDQERIRGLEEQWLQRLSIQMKKVQLIDGF